MNEMNRRTALRHVATVSATLVTLNLVVANSSVKKSSLGLVSYTCGLRARWLAQQSPKIDLLEPLTFLKHCHEVGVSGMQVNLGVLDAERIRALREFAESNSLIIEGIVSPPKDESDVTRFAAEIKTAAEVGALAVRTVVMPGRRYEQFNSLPEFREAEVRAMHMLELARPVVTRHRVRLAVENHKDQRIDERIALYKKINCEFIGACVDTGNSFALLDDPYAAIEALAPYAFSVHIKDHAVSEYAEGFLLADIPLGEGSFDLKKIVDIIQRAKPGIRFQLELITRDPLKITCLTEKYWVTMPTVAGVDLARALHFVKTHASKSLPQVSSLPLKQQVELEDANIAKSLQYASLQLGM